MPDNTEVQESPRESRSEAPPASLQASDMSPSASDVQNANRTGMDSAQNTVNKDFGSPSIGDSTKESGSAKTENQSQTDSSAPTGNMTQEAGLSKTDKTPKPEKSNSDDSKMEKEPENQELYKTPEVSPYSQMGPKPEVTDDQGRNRDGAPYRPESEAPKDNRETGELKSDEGKNPKSFEQNSPENNSKTNFEFGEKGNIDSRTTTDTKTGNQEKVKYDADGKAESKEVTKPGQEAESQPVDGNDTAKAQYDENGKLTSIATTKGNEKSQYNFSDGELKSKISQNSGEVTKDAAGNEKVTGKSDSRTAFENGKEFESQKTNYNDNGVRTSQVNKKDDTTTTRHYDQSGDKVEKTEKLSPREHSMERDFADRKQVDKISSEGKMSRDTTYSDGSSKSESYNPHTKEKTVTSKKDGYTAEMVDNPNMHQSTIKDKDGNWQRYHVDKKTGSMTETDSSGRRFQSRGA